VKDIRLNLLGRLHRPDRYHFQLGGHELQQGRERHFPPTSGAGGFITIIGRAIDGQGNFSEDTLVIFLSNVQALSVTLLGAHHGARSRRRAATSWCRCRAQQVGGILRVGFIVVPAPP